MIEFPSAAADRAVLAALEEDAAACDLTTQWSVPDGLVSEATIISRAHGIIAGLQLVDLVMHHIDPSVSAKPYLADGDTAKPGDILVQLHGPARSLITGERTALNFLQRMSGIATLTSQFVAAVADFGVHVLDTRKTAPGLRALDKYAVRAGGGTNHRMNLAAMVLLKDNHVAAAGGVTAAISAARSAMARSGHSVTVEVEVQTLDEACQALRSGAEWIMLDNMSIPQLRDVVAHRHLATTPNVVLEASGTITLPTARAIAETGVNALSVGALTHSAPALDLSMQLQP
jgi:nicotinate-nucleotide pyrophosphorylase (carboxylating)